MSLIDFFHSVFGNRSQHRVAAAGIVFCITCATAVNVSALSPTPPTATVPLNALSFNGQRAQGVEVPEPVASPFNVESALTVEAWVNVSAWSKRFQAIVTKGESWGIVRADDQSRIAFRTTQSGGGGAVHDLVSTSLFPLGQWTHVAAVWTGSRKQLYTNGVLVADVAYTGGIASTNFPVAIGANSQNADRTLQGVVDSVRIWSAARSEEEIKALQLEYLRGGEVNLIGDWRFNESSGAVALDSSAGGRHGNLIIGKVTSGTLPQRVNGLNLSPPADGPFSLFLTNRTSQYPASLGLLPVTTLQSVVFPLPTPPQSFDFPQGLSAEFWIKPQAIPSSVDVVILTKGSAAWEVTYRETGKVVFRTSGVQSTTAGGGSIELISKARVEPREWTHVAVIWSPVENEKRIYINGVLDQVQAVQGTLGTSVLPITCGFRPGAALPADAFWGAIDEVRLWRYIRTPKEVFENYDLKVNGSEPGLVGVWSFDEALGLSAPESSGRAVAGQLAASMSSVNRVEGVELGEPRLASYTLDLDGATQYVTVADAASLNELSSLTLEAWIKPKAPKAPGYMMIVSKGEDGYGLALDSDRFLRFMVNAGQLSPLKSTGKVELNVWTHVAVVVDGVAGTTTFYINGKASGRIASAVIRKSEGALCIGKVGGTQLSGFFHGGIDEVRIWNVARTPTEIILLAFNETPPGTSGLAGHWSFTEGAGNKVADRVGTNEGTIVAGTSNLWQPGPLFPQSPSLPAGLNYTQNRFAAGLWAGEVVLTKVNEVQKAVNGAAEDVSPTGREATLRILLHVDASGQVRLLKDVIVMQTQAQGVPLPPAKPVLVTDPSQIYNYEGVVKRGGKLVGLRYSAVAYDFPGFEMTMIGGIGPGLGCGGRIDIDKSAPTNPFRHKFHPDHGQGFDIIRVFSLAFDGAPNDPLKAAPGYGVDRITGTYRESVAGLHKITLKTEGTVTLNRISTVPTLNVP
jgi:hypothetical protein